jgi:hypothetical protein
MTNQGEGFSPEVDFIPVAVVAASVSADSHHEPHFLQRHPPELSPAWPRPGGTAMTGGGSPIDWAALAPHIAHPTRESILEALRWIGPLSPLELRGVLDDPQSQLACVSYHVRTLVGEEVLAEIGQRPAGASIEKVYFIAVQE